MKNEKSDKPRLGKAPHDVHVDLDPSNVTTIAPSVEEYVERWWKDEYRDTSDERAHDFLKMPWWTGAPPTSPDDPVFAIELRKRGLDASMFAHPILPEYAKAIDACRKRKGMSVDRVHVAKGFAQRDLSPIGPIAADRDDWEACRNPTAHKKTLKASHDQLVAEQTKLQTEKTQLEAISPPATDAKSLAKLQTCNVKLDANAKKLELVDKRSARADEMEALSPPDRKTRIDHEVQSLDQEQTKLAGDGIIDSWQYGGKGTTDEESKKLTADDDFEKKALAVFHLFQGREGGLNAVVTYDGTFSFGSGFNFSSGLDSLLQYLRTSPKNLAPELEVALSEVRLFFKKNGMWVQAGPRTTPVVAHIETIDGQPRGWIIRGPKNVSVPYGDHESHDIGFEYTRHRKDILNLWAQVGETDSVPEGTSKDVRNLLVRLGFQAYLDMWRPAFKLYKLLTTTAAFAYFAHTNAWGGDYVPDRIIIWAFLRGYVAVKTHHADGSVTSTPLSLRVKNHAADEPSIIQETDSTPGNGKPTKVDSIEPGVGFEFHKPSMELDIQLGQSILRYLVARYPNCPNNPFQWQVAWKHWLEFCSDMTKPDLGGSPDATLSHPFVPLSVFVNAEMDRLRKEGKTPDQKVVEHDVGTTHVIFYKEKALLAGDLSPGYYVAGLKSDVAERSAVDALSQDKRSALIQKLSAAKLDD